MSTTKKTTRSWHAGKDLVLFVERMPVGAEKIIKAHGRTHGRNLKVGVIYDSRSSLSKTYILKHKSMFDVLIPCDFSDHKFITKALQPYLDRLLAITCRSEANMMKFRQIIPHVPYLRTPTMDSLSWSTNKLAMRRRFAAWDKAITPAYTVVHDGGKESIKKIKKKIGFPLVVKPTGLAQSILVTLCFHEEELEAALRRTFRTVNRIYRERDSKEEATVLVEQFIEGEMYSVDAYVDTRGRITFCPMVWIKTGRAIGFDDFFGYQQMTPTRLTKESVAAAEKTATASIRALGLRSTTAHIEMIRDDNTWRIVEVGARPGGFRVELYKLSYGIDHILNDVLIRIPEKVSVSRRIKGTTAAMKFFAKQEGKLVKIKGLKKAEKLKSFYEVTVNKVPGDPCKFAKNGGTSVFNIIMFNKERSELLADIRRLEQMIDIQTVKKSSK
ncbi:hypothetical protein COV06_01070 [Candidatus Uhrbacteria bacterium CG10_big_fil_rev_8_21_14_0_10_50_16]|uniref:ATP-grasp domain-containing protein n=1 Tax=Candidatus Uhrbacteria bacterium CG10_big_fil_rev_8_21_14_0_10_50_16 TaxID=1975039 RepID=A0A2H0RQE4_9BACT|nr:MAG: hypothetical protein COV06_01070 [Candidatus Uhrbacteria bacterium CG10_big_fil_rev_8_21_14_0_10_50_16]